MNSQLSFDEIKFDVTNVQAHARAIFHRTCHMSISSLSRPLFVAMMF